VFGSMSKFWYFSRSVSRSSAVLFALSLTSLMTGCDHFFGHDEQIQDPLVVQEQGLSCVRSVGADVVGYLDGQDQDLVRIADCVSGALTKFADNTRGASPDGWTRGELSSFFENYFKEESQAIGSANDADGSARKGRSASNPDVAPFDGDWVAQARRRAVVTELFRWKSALIGGGDTTLSRGELTRIRNLLSNSRPALADLRGKGRLLGFKHDLSGISADVESLERTVGALRSIGQLLTDELNSNLSSTTNLRAREPMKLQTLSSSLEQAGLRVLEPIERRQLIQAVKSVVLAGNPQEVAGDEWGELVFQTAELWVAALRLQYGIVQNVSAFDRDLYLVEMTVRDLTKSIQRMVDRHGGRINSEEIRGLVNQLGLNGLLPANLQAKSINGALEVIFGKLLGGNSRPDQAELKKGLVAFHLNRINEVVRDWSEGQRVAVAIAGPAGFATIDQAKLTMSQVATTSKDPINEVVRLQMSELILRGRPLIRDLTGRLLLLTKEAYTGYRRSDLEATNIARTLMSAMMRGYSQESARAGSMPQITESEVQEVFMDLKTLGRDLGIVDVRSLQSGTRTFMEANVFLSVADGNQYISLHEMVEWFETVLSAGILADRMHLDLSSDTAGSPRCGTAPLDVFGKTRLKAQCFRDNIASVLRDRLSHLPNFIRALNQAERARQLPQFIASLERATRPLGASDLPLESSDLRVISPVIHYVEALFARYDVDHSGILETAEVWSVYPLIRPFIKKLAVGSDGKPMELSAGLEKAVFSWMIEKGEPPSTSLGGGIALKLHQWSMALSSNEKASFDDIVKILAGFNKVGRDKKNMDVLAMYTKSGKEWEQGITRGEKKMLEKTRDLFQCAADADTDLTRLVQSRRSDIFSINSKLDDEEQALEFLTRFKSLIQSDPQLQLLCLAF